MESRQSRMNKYYDNVVNDENVSYMPSRAKKNQELYKEVSSLELEDFDLNSNASVIGRNTENINLDEIKDILDKKYNERPRKKSFGDAEASTLPEIHLDETREYDINSILEKAKEKKEVNYEEDRLKKIRSDQYDDILNEIELFNKDEDIDDDSGDTLVKSRDVDSKSDKKLRELIDTITAKELIKQENAMDFDGDIDPLDILSDLRGDDENTRVMGMLSQEIAAAEEENEMADRGVKPDLFENSIEIENVSDEDEDDNEIEEETIVVKEIELEQQNEQDEIDVALSQEIKFNKFDETSDDVFDTKDNVEQEDESVIPKTEKSESIEKKDLSIQEDKNLEMDEKIEVSDEKTKEIPTEDKTSNLSKDKKDNWDWDSHDTKTDIKIPDVSDNTSTLENSMIRKTSTFTTSEFADFEDLKEDMKFTKTLVRILVFIIIIVFIAGVVVLLNKYLNLGLF